MKLSSTYKIVFTILIGIFGFAINSKALTESYYAQINSSELSGVNSGNKQNFEIFNLSPIPYDSFVSSAKLSYIQSDNSSGLLRIINKYSGETLYSRTMGDTGIFEYTDILNTVSFWVKIPNNNFGLIFQGSSLQDDEKVLFDNFKLEVTYTIKDKIPPLFLDQKLTAINSNAAQIYILTDEPTFINVFYGKTSVYGSEIMSDNVEAKTEHSITIGGLSDGQTYHYKVEVFDTSGNSITSSDDTFDTLIEYKNTTNLIIDSKILAPENFRVTTSTTDGKPKINLSWSALSDQRIKGYIVYRATSIDKNYTEYKILTSGQTSYEDFTLEDKVTYYYYVCAYTSNQLGSKTPEQAITPKFIVDETTSSTSTSRIFLIVLSAVLIILFVYYAVLKKLGFAQKAKKDIRNILKEPEFFKEN